MKLEKGKIYTIYVTKYALTKGILKIEAEYSGISEMMCDIFSGFYRCTYHGVNRDYTFTLEEAKKIAEKMKNKKISSLKKQIKKLEEMIFKCPE